MSNFMKESRRIHPWKASFTGILLLFISVNECSCFLAPRQQSLCLNNRGLILPDIVGVAPATRNNDTVSDVTLHPNLFEYVGVQPCMIVKGNPLKKKLSILSWKTRRSILQILHARDPLKPKNSCINLECLWYKALATNNKNSPLYDKGLTADMLPRFSRFVVSRPWCRFYPRLVHGRLEVRSAYLNKAIQQDIEDVKKHRSENTKIRIISLGAGYDMRSVRLLSQGLVDECIEMDLPEVVQTKTPLLDVRLRKRRPELCHSDLPSLIGVDLNNVEEFKQHLDGIFSKGNNDGDDWHTIFVAEGVLMYLNKGNSRKILQACANASPTTSSTLCFADRMENVSEVNLDECQNELVQASWQLVDWAPMPFMNARHIGTAKPILCMQEEG